MGYIVTGAMGILVVFVAHTLSKMTIKKREERLSNLDDEKRLIDIEQKLHRDKATTKIYYTILYILIIMWTIASVVV